MFIYCSAKLKNKNIKLQYLVNKPHQPKSATLVELEFTDVGFCGEMKNVEAGINT